MHLHSQTTSCLLALTVRFLKEADAAVLEPKFIISELYHPSLWYTRGRTSRGKS